MSEYLKQELVESRQTNGQLIMFYKAANNLRNVPTTPQSHTMYLHWTDQNQVKSL